MGPLTRLFAATALAMSAPATAAVQITDSNGILIGATGVNVEGTFYDVSFLSGTCASLFTGCNDSSDFDFTTSTSSHAAAQALIDQVFLNVAAGQFDNNSALTLGCYSTTYCITLIPYYSSVSSVLASALFNDSYGPDATALGQINFDEPAGFGGSNYARFTLSSVSAAVPETSTWAMMLLGFGAMGVSLRGRRRTKSLYQAA